MCQQCRLIVAPPKQTPAMKRHGRDKITIFQKLSTGTLEHVAEGARDIGTISMFEAKDHAARTVVIAKGSTRPCKHRRLDNARTTDRLICDCLQQRITAEPATRRPEKSETTPTIGTKAPCPIDHDSTTKTARRQDRIEAAPRRMLHQFA